MGVSPGLARRIDRLARRAHAFHRFAHHPLCERYGGELIALRGRVRICRGCTCTLAAAIAGSTGAFVVDLPGIPLGIAGGVCVALALLYWSRPRNADRPRVGKLWTRGVPAFVVSGALVTWLRAPSALHVSLALALALSCVLAWDRYRRRGPDRSPCTRCPESTSTAICSGFREIVRAERAFTRRSQRLLDAVGDRMLSP